MQYPRHTRSRTASRHAAALTPALLCATALLASPAVQAGPDVGVSVNIGQPGFYGRVDIGNQPPPVLYPQPIIIQQTPVAVVQRPIYLRVPPGHSGNWGRYCGYYRACGQPVYFVRAEPEHGRHDDRDENRRPRWEEERHDDKHGHGHGHGHQHGRGHGHGHGRD